MQKVIAIDGPSASGKGTIAAAVAAELGWDYLDSGALYRLTALHARQNHTAWTDEAQLAQLAQNLPVEFTNGYILLNGQDVGHLIRSEDISMGASAVAKLPAVRDALLQRQRAFLTEKGLVADGRDMASVVFPQALLKIFLTADAEVRACRRARQLGLPEVGSEFEHILADIHARDEADRNRAVAPLKQLPESRLLDTSGLDINASVAAVLTWYEEKNRL